MFKAIEPFGKHSRAAFSCGVTALDDWFHLRAGHDEKRNVARVFVAIDDQRWIIGFYSLSPFTLAIADLSPEHAKRLPRYDVILAALNECLARDERVCAANCLCWTLVYRKNCPRGQIGVAGRTVIAVVVRRRFEKPTSAAGMYWRGWEGFGASCGLVACSATGRPVIQHVRIAPRLFELRGEVSAEVSTDT